MCSEPGWVLGLGEGGRVATCSAQHAAPGLDFGKSLQWKRVEVEPAGKEAEAGAGNVLGEQKGDPQLAWVQVISLFTIKFICLVLLPGWREGGCG